MLLPAKYSFKKEKQSNKDVPGCRTLQGKNTEKLIGQVQTQERGWLYMSEHVQEATGKLLLDDGLGDVESTLWKEKGCEIVFQCKN